MPVKRFFVILAVLGLALALAAPAFCGDEEDYENGNEYGYRMMGPGYGPGWMMDDNHHDRGMMPGQSKRRHQRQRIWQSLKPEQQEKMKKMRADYLMDTLELRKQIAVKRIELRALWAQPKVDSTKVEKLSSELAELRAELAKKRNQQLVKCRQEFGDLGWTCPGGMR